MPSIGMWEILIVLLIILILFGPKKLPELAKSIGRSIREYKQSLSGDVLEDKKSKKK